MDTVLRNKTELMNLAKFGLGYLNDKGWFASVVSGGLSRNNEEELPFYTYPATKFIEGIPKSQIRYLNMGLVAPPFGGLEGLKKLFRLNTIRNGSRISEKMRQII